MQTEVLNIPFSEYQAIDAVNVGSLLPLRESALAYKHKQESTRKVTDAMRFGGLCHTLTLEPSQLSKRYAVWPAANGARRGKAWTSFLAALDGREPIREQDLEPAELLAKSVWDHPIAGPYLAKEGGTELTILWTHDRTGIRCKGRPDKLSSTLIELKTTADPSERVFMSHAARSGYHVQLASYAHAAAKISGKPVPAIWIVVQNEPPFDVVVYDVPAELLEAGWIEYEALIDKLVVCRETGQYPGQAEDRKITAKLPRWKEAELEAVDFATCEFPEPSRGRAT